MSDLQPENPPSFFESVFTEEGEKFPFNDVKCEIGTSNDAWFNTQRLKTIVSNLGNSTRLIYPAAVDLEDVFTFNKRYSIAMTIHDGYETIYRDLEHDWRPANGVIGFRYQGEDLYLVILMDYQRPWQSNWLIACKSVSAGAEFLAAVKKAKKTDPHRECWVIANRSSRSDALLKEVDRLTWDDLVMEAKAKADLRACTEAVFSERTAAVYSRMGIPRKKGLIIHGPPGNGKTMTGKVAAGVMKASLVYVTASQQPGFLRDRTASEIFEEVYQRAQMLAPCVVMLEEIDGLIDKKSRPLLLSILDGLAPNEGVLTIATTNHIEALDPALVNRPSRFDRIFEFGYPGSKPRRDYMERRMRQAMGIPFDRPLDRPLTTALNKAAKMTEGLSFSHLQEIIVVAASNVTEMPGSPPGKSLIMSMERILASFKVEPPAAPQKKTRVSAGTRERENSILTRLQQLSPEAKERANNLFKDIGQDIILE